MPSPEVTVPCARAIPTNAVAPGLGNWAHSLENKAPNKGGSGWSMACEKKNSLSKSVSRARTAQGSLGRNPSPPPRPSRCTMNFQLPLSLRSRAKLNVFDVKRGNLRDRQQAEARPHGRPCAWRN